MPRTKGKPREDEKRGRDTAFRAARLAETAHVSMTEAARRCEANRSSTQEASMILRHGTPQEIDDVENHRLAMGVMVKIIRARTTPEARKALLKPPTFHPSVQENRQFEAEVWAKLREAIDALTSLPVPDDVIKIVKKNAMRGEHVSRKVLTAQTWLEEFVDAWTA